MEVADVEKTNPYLLQFGQPPLEIISRDEQQNEIVNSFLSLQPSQRIYMICGVRGSGKTVFMTTVAAKCNTKEWIVININTASNTSAIEQMAVQLSQQSFLAKKVDVSKITLSAFGFGLQVDNQQRLYNSEQAVITMLKEAKKHEKKVLITIDEVTNTDSIREFAGAFQIWIRQYLPVYLLMTGLYENIKNIQNVDTLTFLYRAPRIELAPLSYLDIQRNYERNLNISENESREMAKSTKGYSFAFQAYGHEVWNENGLTDKAKQRYKEDLFEYSYRKIWDDISINDKKVCEVMANIDSTAVKDIREKLGFETNVFNQYRRRLTERGIVHSKEKGYIMFTLPLFKEFVNYVINEEEF